MKVLKEMELPQKEQNFGESCSLVVRVRLSAIDSFREKLADIADLEEL